MSERAFAIRPAALGDAAAVAAIYNDAVEKTTATFDTQPRSLEAQEKWLRDHGQRWPVLVAEQAGEVAGWASLSRWSERCAYDDTAEDSVYIAQAARGRGLGKALLDALLQAGRRSGFHTVLARIADGNPASVRLHESFGFKTIGVMKEVGFKFGRRIDVSILQLML